ncbi:uncharacterized protein LOC133176573 [Saccostrea echinata]|uniref:uncharacterized protein LOC133176573 n=1 Tax=Saccostrea echinata TaxID=191078 RepID=UPI002A806B9F|nr:uncharacterized protein LOC133176573 [Saccostrea echinata]
MAEKKKMSFLRALENVDLPKVFKMTEGSLQIPKWKTFKGGECFVVFSCEKQVIVKDCIKSNMSRDLKQNMGFIPWDTSELFYDIHCLGKTYDEVEMLIKEFPRYIIPASDLFAICEKDGECESIRVEKKSLLEVKEIREYKGNFSKSGEEYTNAQELHGEMLCCSVKEGPKSGLEIVLPNAIRCGMEIIQDTEKYSMQDIVERFNLPRKVKFCNRQIDQHLIATQKFENEIVASSLSNKMLFLADLGKCNVVCVDKYVQECSNVVCELLENLDLSSVHVEVLENSMEEIDTFCPFYVVPEASMFSDIQTYIIKGTEKKREIKANEGPETDTDRPAQAGIDEEYIELWKPSSPKQPETSGKEGASSEDVSPTQPPRVSSPTTHSAHSPRGSSPTPNISPPPRVLSPTIPPRSKEKCKTMPVAAIKVSDPVISVPPRSMSLPTDSLNPSVEVGKKSLENLGVEALCSLLREYKLDKLADVCKDEKVDGNFITCLTEDDLKDEPFSLGNFQIKKLNKLKSGWRAT